MTDHVHSWLNKTNYLAGLEDWKFTFSLVFPEVTLDLLYNATKLPTHPSSCLQNFFVSLGSNLKLSWHRVDNYFSTTILSSLHAWIGLFFVFAGFCIQFSSRQARTYIYSAHEREWNLNFEFQQNSFLFTRVFRECGFKFLYGFMPWLNAGWFIFISNLMLSVLQICRQALVKSWSSLS